MYSRERIKNAVCRKSFPLASDLGSQFRQIASDARNFSMLLAEDFQKQEGIHHTEDVLKMILSQNRHVTGAYICRKPDAIPPPVTQQPSIKLFYRNEDRRVVQHDPKQRKPGDPKHDRLCMATEYDAVRKNNTVVITDPHPAAYINTPEQVISFVAPIFPNDEFSGILGIDLSVNAIGVDVENANRNHFGGKAEIQVVSRKGLVLASNRQTEIIGKKLPTSDVFPANALQESIRKRIPTTRIQNQKIAAVIPIVDEFVCLLSVDSSVMIDLSHDPSQKEIYSITFRLIAVFAGVFLISIFILFRILSHVLAPVGYAAKRIQHMADGKADGRGDSPDFSDIRADGEIREMMQGLDRFVANLKEVFQEFYVNTRKLTTASTDLSGLSVYLASESEQMSQQTGNVAGATEQMSTSINAMASAAEQMSVNAQNVSSTAEQMSNNMNNIASSVEQMSVAIHDIASNSQVGSDIAGEAMKMSTSATETMNALGVAAKEIGEVTEVIKRIAEQTNLLALNATIEAASAGDAGKGFAVVANEIKELANQSADAAEDITRKIGGVQTNTQEAINAIAQVSNIVEMVNESVKEIKRAVEQQTLMSDEISGNILQANMGVNSIASAIAEIAKGANDMAQNASEGARAVNEVSANIHGVNASAENTRKNSQQVKSEAEFLENIAGHLKQLIEKFKF